MIYTLCIISVLILSYVADKREQRFPVFLCVLILSLFCGLRGVGTGVDTYNYYHFMLYIRESGIYFGSDIGFSIISYFLMGFLDNPYYPLVFFSFITNFLIVYRLWEFRKEASFSLMLLIYMALQYEYVFNIVRQFLAISIIFWGTKYIERGEYIKYTILNIIASTIHTSSLLCFSMLFVRFGYKTKKKKYRILGFGAAAIFVVVGIYAFSTNVAKYIEYFTTPSTSSIYWMVLLKVICVAIVLFANKVLSNDEFSISKNGEAVPMQRQISTLYSLGLMLSLMGMFFPFMNRIGFYFIIFEMPFWGQAIRAKTNRYIYFLFIVFIVGYKLITMYLSGTISDNLFVYHSFLSDM